MTRLRQSLALSLERPNDSSLRFGFPPRCVQAESSLGIQSVNAETEGLFCGVLAGVGDVNAEGVAEVVRQRKRYPSRLLVEDGGVFVPVATADILWVEAAGDYATLHTLRPGGTPKTYLASQGIGQIETRLNPDRFARVHRSTIVALDALRSLERDNSGGFTVELADGVVVRVSRTYAETIRQLMA